MDRVNYWNNFYKNKLIFLPTQFSIFIAGEFPKKKNIIELGCGSARDTFFFNTLYERVIAIDASSEVINLNRRSSNIKNNTLFLINDLSSEIKLANILQKELKEVSNSIFYARFFLHAVDEIIENRMLSLFNIFKNNNNVLALEFRTTKDKNLKKQYGDHYRRFIDTKKLISKLKTFKMNVNYHIEGQGYAKYKSDDAYVARMIIT